MRGPKLFEGARVALIAPSSPVNGDVEAKLDRAVKTAEKLNLIPVLYPTARASHGYLAGTDEMRAKDINDAFADKDIDGIWCLRGGYGAHQDTAPARLYHHTRKRQVLRRIQRHYRFPYRVPPAVRLRHISYDHAHQR